MVRRSAQGKPTKCTKKAHEAKVVAQGLTLGDIFTVFYCQVPGCFWGALHRDGGGFNPVETSIKRHCNLRHPHLMEPRMVTMLRPQAAVAELQTALIALYNRMSMKVVSIQPDKRSMSPLLMWDGIWEVPSPPRRFECLGMVANTRCKRQFPNFDGAESSTRDEALVPHWKRRHKDEVMPKSKTRFYTPGVLSQWKEDKEKKLAKAKKAKMATTVLGHKFERNLNSTPQKTFRLLSCDCT